MSDKKLPDNDRKWQKPKPLPLEEGDFYYTDEGYIVFTEQYHLKRGYCCGSRCRHCPYDWENVRK